MEAAGFEPSVLALRHFGGARLWDRRRTRRLVKTAELLMARPDGRLPRKLADRADLVGLYRNDAPKWALSEVGHPTLPRRAPKEGEMSPFRPARKVRCPPSVLQGR